jgi:hypothetical protein
MNGAHGGSRDGGGGGGGRGGRAVKSTRHAATSNKTKTQRLLAVGRDVKLKSRQGQGSKDQNSESEQQFNEESESTTNKLQEKVS